MGVKEAFSKIPNFSNEGLSVRIRHWLIKKVAGKHAVVLNVRIDLVPRQDHPGYGARVKDMDGCLLDTVIFPDYDEKIIQLSGLSHDQ